MMTQKISEQNWYSVKGEIQKTFSSVSSDELEKTHGNARLLTDLISKKEGLAHADAEKRLDEIVARYRAEAAAASFYDDDDFEDYIDADADDERFGTDEGLTSPASHSFSGPRSEKPDRSSTSEFSSERRGPERNPAPGPGSKKNDRGI